MPRSTLQQPVILVYRSSSVFNTTVEAACMNHTLQYLNVNLFPKASIVTLAQLLEDRKSLKTTWALLG